MACSVSPCCPPSCTSQVVFPNSISISTTSGTILNTNSSGIGTVTVITIGPATYFPGIASDNTLLPIAYGGGCETLTCCPCTIYYTVAIINPNNADGIDNITLSGTFAINIHDGCCATIPSTILKGLVPNTTRLASVGVMYPTTATIGFDPCTNIRTITVSSINIVFGATTVIESLPTCCTNGCMQPCDVTAITASAATPITGSGYKNDVLTIGSVVLAYNDTTGKKWLGGGGYTLCTSPTTFVLPVTLRNTAGTDHTGKYLAGCLRLCVTGMFGFVQLESTTLYGYDTTSPVTAITKTLTGSADLSFCNGVRKINISNINVT